MEKTQLVHLFNKMTLQEKIGQLSQVSPQFLEDSTEVALTGPLQHVTVSEESRYTFGSTLNTQTKEQAYEIQKHYLENSRLKIPLLIMADVIHGYRTIFPIPLAIGASWNIDVAEEIAELSALEASSEGIHVTFSPMVDLVRDPRWGRVLESTGEDSYLNSLYAEAFVNGYQGVEDLSAHPDRIATCVKHFVGYGLSEAGRDYNRVDMSELELHQNHLPAYEAAIAAGAKLVMTSFNIFNGIPVTGNKKLLQETLRDKLKFDGVVISDWDSVGEMVNNGVAENHKQAAKLALDAGVDIDMMSFSYYQALEELVAEKPDFLENIDKAVWRVLTLKNELGLFENPYRGIQQVDTKVIREKARSIASKTLVLLENKNAALPLNKEAKIGLIGPLAASHDVLGSWSMMGDKEQSVTLAEGMKAYAKDLQVAAIEMVDHVTESEWQSVHHVFETSDILVLALGEESRESGEGASKAEITLHPVQIQLLKKAKETGKKVVTVLFNGRPLDLREVEMHSDAVIEAWYPGTEAGHAVADVLFGTVNPSGKLSMTFPYSNGQIPVYYNHIRTGRPLTEETKGQQYVSRYLDIPNDPLYPFGYGKSYSTFKLHTIKQNQVELASHDKIIFTGTIENISDYDGRETIQLYIHDRAAEVVRPIKELKAFTQVFVPAHTEKIITFELTIDDLAYVHSDLTSYADPGSFDVFIGTDSNTEKVGAFELIEGGNIK